MNSLRDMVDMRTTPLVELRLADRGQSGVIAGYASTWGGPPDSYGTMFAPGAFTRTLREHKAEGTSPIMLWAHNKSEPIGRWIDLSEDDTGLLVRGQLNLETDRGQQAHRHLKAGDVSGLSVGVYLDTKGGIVRNNDGTATITKADLFEISVVAIPSNKRARIAQVRSLQSKTELVDLLREAGLAKAAAARIAAGGWPALAGEDQTRAIALAERIAAQTEKLRTMK